MDFPSFIIEFNTALFDFKRRREGAEVIDAGVALELVLQCFAGVHVFQVAWVTSHDV